jgi:hypothetical protein
MSDRPGLPTRALLQPLGLYLELRDIAPEQLQDPFMQQTVVRVPAKPSFVEILKANIGKNASETAPAAVIFHVGRCGSTVISQSLKRAQCIVYSEPLPFNEILAPPRKWERADVVGALRTLAGAFAAHAAKPYVLKLSSWNTLFCDLIIDAFPATPWILSLRDPVPVCVSLLSEKPGWLSDAGTPKNMFASLVDPDQRSRTAEDFVARLYGAYCRAICRIDTARALIIPYESLPNSIWESVAPHFGLSLSEKNRSSMTAASGEYSKAPFGTAKPFAPDDMRKRAAASRELQEAIDALARPDLEKLRARFQKNFAT